MEQANKAGIDLDQDNIRRLISQLRSRPGIVPFVGAGVSVPYGMQGWEGFLLTLAQQYGFEQEVGDKLHAGEFDLAAEVILDDIGKLAFDDEVERWFGDNNICMPAEKTIADLIVELAHGPVITTNFDRVLERVFANAGSPFDQELLGAQVESIAAAVQHDQRILIKLHGDVYDRQHRILTRSEYDAHYRHGPDDAPEGPIPGILNRMLGARTVLFLGCSLKSDRTVPVIDRTGNQAAAFTHFAIVAKPETPEQFRARLKELSELRIRPIWYPHGQYRAVVTILEHVSRELRRPALPAQQRVLVSGPEFFEPFVNQPGRLFRHDWDLVGRTDILETLRQWVNNDERQVAVVSGRGGAGKSKVLQGFAEEFQDPNGETHVLFVLPNSRFVDAQAVLPDVSRLVIVVDDAHQRDDLADVLAYVQRDPRRLKLLMTTRSHHRNFIESKLGASGFDVRQIVSQPLPDLSIDAIRDLARQALGHGYERYADRLVAISRDSPLVTVIGGQLLSQRSVSPELLERDEEFRGAVLDRFSEVLEGRIADLVEPRLQRDLLSLLAAVGPIRSDDAYFLNEAGAFLGVRSDHVAEALDAFEYTNILIRRGRILRITPDVLADHILFRACIRLDGTPTGYAERIFFAFRENYSDTILMSLAELDWRLRESNEPGSLLLQGIWQALEQEMHTASHRERYQLLRKLTGTGALQPDRMLPLVEFVMRNPNAPEMPGHAGLERDTHIGVLETVAPILFNIGHNPEYLPRVCDLLWELSRGDDRPLNQYPEHPVRLLQELAKYDYEKPLAINAAVLDRISRWVIDPSAFSNKHTPLDVLDPLLVKTDTSQRLDRHLLVISPVTVDVELTRNIRDRAIEILDVARSRKDSSVDLRVLESLSKIIEAPRLFSGAFLSPEDSAAWLPERMRGFEKLRSLAVDSAERGERGILLKIAQKLTWYVTHEQEPEVREAAITIIGSIPIDLKMLLMASLSHEFSIWRPLDGTYDPRDRDARKRLVERIIRECIAELIGQFPEPADGANAIELSLHSLSESGINPAPYEFWDNLADVDVQYSIGLASYVIDHKPVELSRYLGSTLAEVRDSAPDQAIGLAQRILESGDPDLVFALARWPAVCAAGPQAADFDIITELLSFEDMRLRYHVLDSMARLGKSYPHELTELAIATDIDHDSSLGDALCQIFDADLGISPELLEQDDICAILRKLSVVDSIDGYSTRRFLRSIHAKYPADLIDMLIRRLRAADRLVPHPIPYDGLADVFDGFSDHEFYAEALVRVRDLALEDQRRFSSRLPKLFATVVDGFGPEAEALIREWIDSGDAARIEGAALLVSKMPPSFVFDFVSLVVDLVEAAVHVGHATYHRVEFHLRNSNVTQMRSRTIGVEAVTSQDEELKRHADEAMENLTVGSPGYRFFANLKSFAEGNMRRDILEDEEEFD